MLTKSAKLNCWPGVLKPVIPGVPIIEEGRAWSLGGGVEGGNIRDEFAPGFAGEGDVARNRSKSASPAALTLRWRAARLRVGGGVRGGEEWNTEESIRKDCEGRSLLSSSETGPNVGESAIVDISEAKERCGACMLENCDS